jgi:hypothetical protein
MLEPSIRLQKLDVVEGSVPSEEEKESTYGVRARDVGALATPEVMAPLVGKRRNFG